MRSENWAGLEVCITGGPDGEGGGTGPVVMLLHGFGAPGDDLVPLWRMIDVPNEIRFLFPAAPLSLNLGFGESRAWWMLDMERLTLARAQGQWDTLIREIPAGLQAAHDQLMKFLDQAKHHMHIPSQHLAIGGFSQGSMLGLRFSASNQPFHRRSYCDVRLYHFTRFLVFLQFLNVKAFGLSKPWDR